MTIEDSSKADKTSKNKLLSERWQLIPSFIACRGLMKQHVKSYNHFVNYELGQIVKANGKLLCDSVPSFYLKYIDARVGYPVIDDSYGISRSITPHECRLRDLTYSAPILVDVEYTRGCQRVLRKGLIIGYLPVMLRSCRCVLDGKSESEITSLFECPLDPGGYFIVRGTERVILIQEQLATNRILLEKDSSRDIFICSVTSSTHITKSKTAVLGHPSGRYFIRHNSLKEDIPIAIMFRALGITSDQEIIQLIGTDDDDAIGLMAGSLEDCHRRRIFTQNQALRFLHSRMKGGQSFSGENPSSNIISSANRKDKQLDEIRQLLCNLIVSHLHVKNFDYRVKAIFIAHMLRRVILAEKGKVKPVDRDYYGNKKLELSGELISILFEDLFKRFNSELQKTVSKLGAKSSSKGDFDILQHVRSDVITIGLVNSFATGNWTIKRFRMDRAGVTDVVSRLSYISCFGMMTRITSQFEKSMKVSGPRSLQTSQWGMLCPADTPEGEACGLVKNLALTTEVTTNVDPGPVETMLFNIGVEDIRTIHNPHDGYLVLVNGNIIGCTLHPKRITKSLRHLRRGGYINPFISFNISVMYRTLQISCDSGRLCRPYIIVDPTTGQPRVTDEHLEHLKKKFLTFDDFVQKGLIEYLDVNEMNDAFIAVYPDDIKTKLTTHLEISPFTILGACAGLIPYPHHNQSPRNTYQCAMGKQAMGSIGYNQQQRIDTLLNLLVYPQRPLVQTKQIELINFHRLPAGQNAMVAVMSYSGYDIEDALIVNKSSLDRGFGRCMVYRKYGTQLKRYGANSFDKIMGPVLVENKKNRNGEGEAYMPIWTHSSLDQDGIAAPGSLVDRRQCLVNKHSPICTSTSNSLTTTNASASNTSTSNPVPSNATSSNTNPSTAVSSNPSSMQGHISTPLTYNGHPAHIDRAMLAGTNDDQILIKLLLRQTRRPEVGDKFSSRHGQKGVIGLIVKQEDMPYTEQGICPDIIMNPHGYPSRMTVGKLLELVGSKAALLDGRFGDGTAFEGDSLQEISECLLKHGYHFEGKELLFSGITGQPMEAYIYFGPIYYQKLKHMVMDKMHARARGPKTALTRQPTEGRSRDGGLRLGEMERDCLIGHGASLLLLERLCISSDQCTVEVCEQCGLLGCYDGWCHYCQSSEHSCTVNIPYACKLLFQELTSMNVVPRLSMKKLI
ncbi:hypothetical protein GJ496_007640 [Pomphorhynchus laevis]|nr:hypothetical protein GJ496_007640 [Pomphorhynchus laevis]